MSNLFRTIKPYAKSLVAALGAVLVVLSESGLFVDSPWFTIAVAVATLAGVYQVPNKPLPDAPVA